MKKTEIISHWQHVREGLLQVLDRFHDAELDFQPYEGGWSAREIMLYIAHEESGEFGHGILQTLPAFPPELNPRQYPTKAEIRSLLQSIHAPVLDYLQTLADQDLDRTIVAPWGPENTLAEMIGHMIEHEIHHRGELSLILGMLGHEGLDV